MYVNVNAIMPMLADAHISSLATCGISACTRKPKSERGHLTLHVILEYVLLTSPLP